jgi:ATP-dependent DNA helicase RecG
MFPNFFFSPLDKALNIKPITSEHLARLGLHIVRDLLFHIPYSFNQRLINPNITFLKEGENIIVDVVVESIDIPDRKSPKNPIKIICGNNTGTITLNYFNKIPPFILQKLRIGNKLRISGIVHKYNYHINISHPDILETKDVKDLEPCYHLTYGITNQQISNYIQKLLGYLAQIDLPEWLAEEIIVQENLPSFKEAIFQIHNPSSEIDYEKYKKRLKYDELFANQIALGIFRLQSQGRKPYSYGKAESLQKEILLKLNFELTEDQNKVIGEIEADQASNNRMMRLLQGDVGSGKTIVALMTMINAVMGGIGGSDGFQTKILERDRVSVAQYVRRDESRQICSIKPVRTSYMQSALMAPTDILASQHYVFFEKALNNSNIKIALLTGKTKTAERKQILEGLISGEIHILIGTHAIFQENVVFQKLAYVVIDEQHRFGVNQRIQLVSKGEHTDLLIMTATPIPRSLCLTLFGDMVSSKICSKPKNRIPIKTSVMHVDKIDSVVEQLKNKINDSEERAYWVCPLVKHEEDAPEDFINLMSATKRFESLRKIFGNKVGLIHGKMPSAEKEDVMNKFKNGLLKILVATTVIEVGIDVPEANLIIIENAERFGLATLHQLRGRVGRGSAASFCLLIYDYPLSAIAKERLKVMKESSDGFEISEKDLELRGGGEILGTKQSGEQNFVFVDLHKDQKLLFTAHKASSKLSVQEVMGDKNKRFLLSLYGYNNFDKILG